MLRLRSSLVLLFASSLAWGCGGDLEPGVDGEGGEAPDTQAGEQAEAPDGGVLKIRRDADGSVFALSRRDRAPIFRFDPSGEPAEAFLAFARENAEVLGLDPVRDGERLTTLKLERVVEVSETLRIHRYEQRYRGHRIAGAGATLALTSLADGSVVAVHGSLLDERRELAGLSPKTSAESARAVVAGAVEGSELPADVELVAHPRRGVMAWSADAGWPARHRVLVSAADGTVLSKVSLAAHDAFDHAPLTSVRAYQMTNNPGTATTAGYPSFGSLWDGSYNPFYGYLVRMGDDRAVVYDLEQANNAQPTTYLTPQYQPTNVPNQFFALYSAFVATLASDANQFRTQNLYHKMRVALGHLDARQSTLGWDHAPGTPFGLFTPAPLNLLTNVDGTPESGAEPDFCNDALATYNDCSMGGASIQHPYPGETTSCIYMCSSSVGSLLHELGHHVDNHADYGIMGSDGGFDSCLQDTADESIPLRETIGDMTALYLTRKMYATLPYTFSTASSPCTFGSIGQGPFAVHDPTCVDAVADIGVFDDDRPDHDPTQACNHSDGYRMRSVNQAVWAWLNRRSCSTVAPYSCNVFIGGNTDDFMSAMVYALAVSNAQSYETFFENIELYYEYMVSGTEADNFRTIMAKYGILDP